MEPPASGLDWAMVEMPIFSLHFPLCSIIQWHLNGVRVSVPTFNGFSLLKEFYKCGNPGHSCTIRNAKSMLTDETLAQFLTSHPTRSYSLLIFFDTIQLHDKPELHLQSLHSDFALVAHSFISNNKLFFCDIEFKHSQSSFSLFSDQAHFSCLLDSLPDFVQSHTGLSVGPIDRPLAISTRQLILIFLLALVLAPFLVKRVLEGDTLLHEPLLWMTLSMFDYFFSVSGAMHNIIRKMPMFMADPNDPSRLVNQSPSLVPLSKSTPGSILAGQT
ncbi:hypothetical protein Sjap_016094 [Stephania japonica]|uniref:Uncharacterized protein n=1 Tax=Stephania japonica TaxID=461633 RepID=A0AAP0IKM3_9MAGN